MTCGVCPNEAQHDHKHEDVGDKDQNESRPTTKSAFSSGEGAQS